MAAAFNNSGYEVGGFRACISSDVLPGSGLSSSGTIEVLLATIINKLFNEGVVPVEKIARFCQFAENEYYGKPCGLMDQLACAYGGVLSIDFQNPDNPGVYNVEFDFNSHPYQMLIVDTNRNGQKLPSDYSDIPKEMKAVANFLGTNCLREIDVRVFKQLLPDIRKKLGDRPLLRALHFVDENQRVLDQVSALETGDFNTFLNLVNQSGISSARWLQNMYSISSPQKQGINLGLALTEQFIKDSGFGACRVHGGGFAGTILVFILEKYLSRYKIYMERVFGEGSVMPLQIRKRGSLYLNPFLNVEG